MKQRILRMVLGLSALVAAGSTATASPSGSATSTLSGTITVSAAASLTTAFQRIATAFERRHKGTSIEFNFGSSATLVAQIQGGAPADVFASADLSNMDKLVSTGFVTATPKIFVRNSIEIAVKRGNPQHITGVRSLATAGTIAMCAATAPCGIYGRTVLARAKVTVPTSSITRAPDAISTVAQVSNGDAVAALVYASDVTAAGRSVQGVSIPADQNVTAFYPIAPITGSANRKLAKAFIAAVVSPAGRRVLAHYGFRAPAPPI